MNPEERIKLECKGHEKAIYSLERDINLYSKDIFTLINNLQEKNFGGYKDASSVWSIICAKADSNLRMQITIEDLQQLITLKKSLLKNEMESTTV